MSYSAAGPNIVGGEGTEVSGGWNLFGLTFYVSAFAVMASLALGVILGLVPMLKAQDAIANGKVLQGTITSSVIRGVGLGNLGSVQNEVKFRAPIDPAKGMDDPSNILVGAGTHAPNYKDDERIAERFRYSAYWAKNSVVPVHYISKDNYVLGNEVNGVFSLIFAAGVVVAALASTVVISELMTIQNYRKRRDRLASKPVPLAQYHPATGQPQWRAMISSETRKRMKSGPPWAAHTFAAFITTIFLAYFGWAMMTGSNLAKSDIFILFGICFAYLWLSYVWFVGPAVKKVASDITDNMRQSLAFQRALTRKLTLAPWSKNQLNFKDREIHIDSIRFSEGDNYWKASLTKSLSRITVERV